MLVEYNCLCFMFGDEVYDCWCFFGGGEVVFSVCVCSVNIVNDGGVVC